MILAILLVALQLGPELVEPPVDGRCFYQSKTGEGAAMFFDNCGVLDDQGLPLLTAEHLENLAYDEDGLACMGFSSDYTFLLHEDGRAHQVIWYDNWCDYFQEGLARGLVERKVVFINKKLEPKVTTQFDWAGHFRDGHALVCDGPFVREQHGEHYFMRGGSCGMIDRNGRLVVPAEHPMENIDVIRSLLETQHTQRDE